MKTYESPIMLALIMKSEDILTVSDGIDSDLKISWNDGFRQVQSLD